VKGAQFFLDVLTTMSNIPSMPSALFVVFGNTALRHLQARIRERNLGHLVTFAGYGELQADVYPAMDVAILTSSTEGLSISLLEAMAWGLPVVATAVGGNSEIVQHGYTGYLVKHGDADAFAEHLVTLTKEPDLCWRLGDAGRKTVSERFDVNRVAEEYSALYEGLASQTVIRRKPGESPE
jgi:glycosyltransferase involved in cell wall biosynthesis